MPKADIAQLCPQVLLLRRARLPRSRHVAVVRDGGECLVASHGVIVQPCAETEGGIEACPRQVRSMADSGRKRGRWCCRRSILVVLGTGSEGQSLARS
jgi:hypothetical protein